MCELTYKEVLKLCQTNKELATKYIINLYNKYNPIYKNLKIDKPLLSIINFVPLPYKFDISYLDNANKIEEKNNKYIFTGTPGDRILFGNRRLPHYKTDAIPFTIPLTLNNETQLIQSNIFYYEIRLEDEYIRESWNNECLSIGFGTKNINYKGQVGWTQNSWGFHSDDGKYLHKNNEVNFGPPWKTGDVVGVGLIYDSSNVYKLFLTINGIFINDEIEISSFDYIYPIIGFDLSKPIKVNWGTEEFIFDLEKYINCNKLLNNKNTFMTRNNDDLDDYIFKPTAQNNKYELFKNMVSITSLLNSTNSQITTIPLFNSTTINLMNNNIFDILEKPLSYILNNDASYNLINNTSYISPINVYSPIQIMDISSNNINMSMNHMDTSSNNIIMSMNNMDTSMNNIIMSMNNIDMSMNNMDTSMNNMDTSMNNMDIYMLMNNINMITIEDISTNNINMSS